MQTFLQFSDEAQLSAEISGIKQTIDLHASRFLSSQNEGLLVKHSTLISQNDRTAWG